MLVCTALGQILIKSASDKLPKNISMQSMVAFFDLKIVLGIIITLIAPIFYMLSLQYLELSVAFALSSINYISIMLLGRYMYNEKLTTKKIIGTILIVAGISAFNL